MCTISLFARNTHSSGLILHNKLIQRTKCDLKRELTDFWMSVSHDLSIGDGGNGYSKSRFVVAHWDSQIERFMFVITMFAGRICQTVASVRVQTMTGKDFLEKSTFRAFSPDFSKFSNWFCLKCGPFAPLKWWKTSINACLCQARDYKVKLSISVY